MNKRDLVRALLASTSVSLAIFAACGGEEATPGIPLDAGVHDGSIRNGDSSVTPGVDSSSGADTSMGSNDSSPGPDTSVTDALGDQAVTNTDSGDAARCNPATAFGAPVPLTTLNTPYDDEFAQLMPDERTLYFSSDRPGGLGQDDIYVSMRTTVDAGWGAPSLVPGVNTSGDERGPSVTGDALFLYAFTGVGPNYQVAVATRPDTLTNFGALGLVTAIDSSGNRNHTEHVLPDHSALYFASDRDGGVLQLYRAARVAGSFQTPQGVAGSFVNTSDNASYPTITPDELTLYFTSDRSGGAGSLDIWMATRASTSVDFGAAVNVVGVNTPGIDQPSWISADGCVLYYTSNGGGGAYDLYVATRGP
jgi:hypothetical protein